MPWTYDTSDLDGEEIVGTFYEKKIAIDKSKGTDDRKSNKEKRR